MSVRDARTDVLLLLELRVAERPATGEQEAEPGAGLPASRPVGEQAGRTAGQDRRGAVHDRTTDPHVAVGPFEVLDAGCDGVLARMVAGGLTPGRFIAYALHVGGLNNRRDAAFVSAMRAADLVYADGASVVLLARLSGAQQIQRSPTTDLGWSVLRQLSEAFARPVRVAIVGGVDGLSARTGEALREKLGVEVVAAESGFQLDWRPCLTRLAASDCDVLIVGLGAPAEMKWVEQHRNELPSCLVITCGGWFHFVVDDEKRAPAWVQDRGLEWCYRLAQAPRRLGRRYARGALVCLAVALQTMTARARGFLHA